MEEGYLWDSKNFVNIPQLPLCFIDGENISSYGLCYRSGPWKKKNWNQYLIAPGIILILVCSSWRSSDDSSSSNRPVKFHPPQEFDLFYIKHFPFETSISLPLSIHLTSLNSKLCIPFQQSSSIPRRIHCPKGTKRKIYYWCQGPPAEGKKSGYFFLPRCSHMGFGGRKIYYFLGRVRLSAGYLILLNL